MGTFLERLDNEQKELQIKLNGLSKFIGTDPYNELSEANRELLHLQYTHMHEYNRILKIRLELIRK